MLAHKDVEGVGREGSQRSINTPKKNAHLLLAAPPGPKKGGMLVQNSCNEQDFWGMLHA
jgi:hypothetical protein